MKIWKLALLLVALALNDLFLLAWQNQRWAAQPIPHHEGYFTPQTPLVHAGVHYGNGFWRADLVRTWTQVQWNLRGDECRQNTPFRINARSDVPLCIATDMSAGNSYLAVSMDPGALESAGDPAYTTYFGWKNTATGSIYYDRKVTGHDNEAVCINIGGQGGGRPNHVMIGDGYILPYGPGKPGQVMTVPTNGNQLVWSWPK